uniref:AP2/ERF transcription factor n=1 Tax=Camptotheca acuminata TaxID=16922 RepID=A0A7G8AUA7_CAMAC|nr:AP2/ERF transcription factor [Camptotheca acuminata]
MWSRVWDGRTQLGDDMLWRLRPESYCEELEQCKHKMNYHCNGCNCSGMGREKLFSKVVTQSDIKQCRLAIPKQQIKKHFPLRVARKGALFLTVDDSGKVWKFRYSFWKSTQNWVFTGGWNRFVKEKGLNVGDIVSFLCSTDPNNKLYYIHWKPQTKFNTVPKPESQVVKLFGVDISTTNMN